MDRPTELARGDDAVALVRRVSAPGRTVLVGIDGCGGAGKSSLAARIAGALPDIAVVHIDDFAARAIAEWDWDRFRAQVVLPLQAGRATRYQRWDLDRDEAAEWHDLMPGRTVLIEGVSCTRREVGARWTATVWVETPHEIRLARALERDGAAMLSTWVEQWLPSEDAYVARENPRGRADLVVSGIADTIEVRPVRTDDLAAVAAAIPEPRVIAPDALIAWVGPRVVGIAERTPDGRCTSTVPAAMQGHGVERALGAAAS